MKRNVIMLVCALCCMAAFTKTFAQQADTATYTGAKATKKMYKAVYQLNSGDTAKIRGTLHNINNALSDPRLTGKLTLELVVHGEGIKLFMKDGYFEQDLLALKKKGVVLAECLNTMRARNITKEQLYDFIGFVPSGNGELIILEQQGWAIIHP
jgi:intracellular sulfur oxidation DsrE/DsrF family protein